MIIIRLAGYDIPLIVRKSDGGYGYDSTDMAAIQYRIRDLGRYCIDYIAAYMLLLLLLLLLLHC